MKRPNILVFFVDQQRGDSIYPYCKARMPNTEAFCKEGVTFSEAHTIAPHCSPSRATFFTGLYPTEHGVWNNVGVGNTLSKGLFDGIKVFSEDLRDNGYRTYYYGKWHVSGVESAADRGFEYTYKSDKSKQKRENVPPTQYEWDKNYKTYSHPGKRQEGQIIRDGYSDFQAYGVKEERNEDALIDSAIDMIKHRAENDKKNNMKVIIDGDIVEATEDMPWFQMINTNMTHDAYMVPKRYLDMYDINDIKLPDNFYDDMKDKPNLHRKLKEHVFNQMTPEEHRECIRHYLACCSCEDDMFGRVLKALDESGERDNTIVIYASDHGDYMGEHGLWAKGLPCFEGAYHVTSAFRWPQGIKNPGRVVDDFITLADYAPTFLDIAGIKPDRKFSGYSLKNYLLDEKPSHVQKELYTQSNGNELYGIQRSVRTKDWKFVYNGFDFDELYDLKNDPGEMVNVFEKYKNDPIVRELSYKMWKFAKERGDVCINPYIMVGMAPYGPGIINDEEMKAKYD